jgi:hypothetical protein
VAVAQRERLTVDPRLRAGIGLVVAGEDFDERRLARPVLTYKRVDLTRGDVEVDVDQRGLAGKGLRQLSDFAACRPRTASPRTTNSAIIAQRPDSKTSKLWAVSINYPLTYCAVGNSSASHPKETEGDT